MSAPVPVPSPPAQQEKPRGSHPDGEVRKNPPSAFHPRHRPQPPPRRGPLTLKKQRVMKKMLINSKQVGRHGKGVKGTSEALSLISLLEPGTAAEGPRVQDFFEHCTPAALRRDSLQGA